MLSRLKKRRKRKDTRDQRVNDDEPTVTIKELEDVAKMVCDQADRKAGIKREPRVKTHE